MRLQRSYSQWVHCLPTNLEQVSIIRLWYTFKFLYDSLFLVSLAKGSRKFITFIKYNLSRQAMGLWWKTIHRRSSVGPWSTTFWVCYFPHLLYQLTNLFKILINILSSALVFRSYIHLHQCSNNPEAFLVYLCFNTCKSCHNIRDWNFNKFEVIKIELLWWV